MPDKIVMTTGKKKQVTNTQLIRKAPKEQKACDKFMQQYYDFLKKIIASHCIWAGRKKVGIYSPQGIMDDIIEDLNPLIGEVCDEFLKKKVTPKFIEDIRKTHRHEAAKGHHVSVRTTLQTMLVNKLKKNTEDRLIVKFSPHTIDLYLKKSRNATLWQVENQSSATGGFQAPRACCLLTAKEVRELLRHFRIMLTRMAGKGDVSMYPTPYECYCLYHDCFGADREKTVQAYVAAPAEQEKFLTREEWNDETVGALLSHRYKGKTQTKNNRKISCERRTIANRRLEYQEHLLECIQRYMPDADWEVAEKILNKRDMDADAVMDFCTCFIHDADLTSAEASEQMKTRTLEAVK